jgi:NADP-dependent 3-hydroxy acid dehydrogenase YdfG
MNSRTLDQRPTSILITGAAGGIGSALTRAYATPGTQLFLGDLDARRLEALTDVCRTLGATAAGAVVDVTDRNAMAAWITEADAVQPLDLVIVLAGISHGTVQQEETPEEIRAVFAVNLDGMLNTIEPILPRMRNRRRGQIALMSSQAGFRGFAVAPSYCATKSAIWAYAEGLRGRLLREHIGVSVIIPGFVKTALTDDNPYPMPFRISAERAAGIIKRGLARNQARIRFPQPIPAVVYLLSLLPPSWVDRFVTLK